VSGSACFKVVGYGGGGVDGGGIVALELVYHGNRVGVSYD